MRRCVAVGLIAALPMGAWLLRNYLLTGMLTEHSPPVDYSLAELALEALGGLWGWAYFNPAWARIDGLEFLPAVTAALLLAALGAIAVGYPMARVLRGEGDSAIGEPALLAVRRFRAVVRGGLVLFALWAGAAAQRG